MPSRSVEVREIISSGILESYVLGIASEQEIARVQAWIAQYPEVRAEIEVIENTLLAAAEGSAPVLRPAVKDKLMKKVARQDARVVELGASRPSSNLYKYGIAASFLLLIGSAAVNVMLYNRLHNAEQRMADIDREKSLMASQMEVNATSLQEARQDLAFLTDTMVTAIHLKPMPKMPASNAMVYWNRKSKEVYLNVMELPAPPEGKQYQLWALANGQPVDAGVFSATDTIQLQKLKDVLSAQAFAVTLEKEGGSPTPTLTEMYMMGSMQ